MIKIKNQCMGFMLTAIPLLSLSTPCMAQNPYLPLWEHVPDGEPRVFEDPDNPGKYRAYIIGSHDTSFKSYCGSDIRMWSAPTEDLTQWRDEGAIFSYHINNQWDTMFAPDLVEIKRKDGTKDYYLYPHSRGHKRVRMVCKGKRPDGPFTPINLNADGTEELPGSILDFDPSVYIENITDPKDPDYDTGFRAYGYWGFQHSSAAQLDPSTMYSLRPGTELIKYSLPACDAQGNVRDPKGTTYPIIKGQKPTDFNFFEASSIRKVGNKYVMIYSGYSGKEYGLGNTNSTLRYAYGDTPLGPWKNGGVLVDSRGVVPNEDGTKLITSNAAHNTHGSLQEINGQWYVFYHRPPRGFGFARQSVVAPVTIQWDKKSVEEGGKVVIRAYDPYNKKGIWTAKASDNTEYTGAEVTSEGFQIYGLNPYHYYSAGIASYLSNNQAMQDAWDVWNNHMPVNMNAGDIVGFKYFGFGGLSKAQKGLQPFEGTKKGNGTQLNIFVKAKTQKSFKIKVMMDGPWANKTWNGKLLGELTVPTQISAQGIQKLTLDVADKVDGIGKKHAIYLIAEGEGKQLCELEGLGFTKKGENMECPVSPTIEIKMNGRKLNVPTIPTRMTNENGNFGYNEYDVIASLQTGEKSAPRITASSDNKEVEIEIIQPKTLQDKAYVKCTYKGISKNYTIHIK